MTTKAFSFLTATNDTTDRTNEILSILQTDGICHLGAGDFYVHNLVMPENTTLIGSGACTRLFLPEELEEGFIIEIKTRCTVKDLFLKGSNDWIKTSETVGRRHGFLFQSPDPMDDSIIPNFGTIDNCHISGFQGGGITCNGTGYSITASINVSNCWITNCDAGINIAYWSEFHRFTNVSCTSCWYGCVNNGGNNVFTNCGFNCNQLAFLIDNSQKQSPNNSHGSAIGCTFNHSGNNEGTGIKILGAPHGYVFSGCQLFFSKIEIENSTGIVFEAMNAGNKEQIFVTGGCSVLFANSMFNTPPIVTIKDNEHTNFVHCYTRKTGELIVLNDDQSNC